MKNILICQHGGSKNHGCEALARTVCSLFPDSAVVLYSFRAPEDREFLGDIKGLTIRGFEKLPGKFSPYNLKYHLMKKLGREIPKIPLTGEFKAECEKADLIIAIGGDNYCYNEGRGYWAADRYIASLKKPYVLLSCSIEPDDLKGELASHLRLFDLITVRESISFEALKNAGLEQAELCCDPAFLLDWAPGEEANAVGINISPMIINSEKSRGQAERNYEELVSAILSETDMEIRLIPHVTWEESDDRVPLQRLYEKFKDSGRVTVVPERDAMRLKKAIASCRFFVGARTHSTIAAYSAGVPTLTVGYSVKARGIARDLFSDERGYVLPVQELSEPDQLKRAFWSLMEREDEIRERLGNVLPQIRESALRNRELIKSLCERGVKADCSGCGACAAVCPEGAIRMLEDQEGFFYPETDMGLCINCSACRDVCPMKKSYRSAPEAWAVKARDEIRKNSSSGGAFGAMAECVLERGGTVFGAAWGGGFALRHRAVRDKQSLPLIQKSKYIPSSVSCSDIRDALTRGPVLFCGTPCQVAGVREALGDRRELFLCQLVCHGVATPKGFLRRLHDLEDLFGSHAESYDFRKKPEGGEGYFAQCLFSNGKQYLAPSGEDPYMCTYLSNVMLRPSCYHCKIRGSSSPADVTLGDLWGGARLAGGFDDGLGVSLVLCHTEKGRALLERSELEKVAVDLARAAKYNPCLSEPVKMPEGRAAFFHGLDQGAPFGELARPAPRGSFLSRLKNRLFE